MKTKWKMAKGYLPDWLAWDALGNGCRLEPTEALSGGLGARRAPRSAPGFGDEELPRSFPVAKRHEEEAITWVAANQLEHSIPASPDCPFSRTHKTDFCKRHWFWQALVLPHGCVSRWDEQKWAVSLWFSFSFSTYTEQLQKRVPS